MTLRNKTIMEPGLTDALQNLKQDIFYNLNCFKVGQIQSFDATKKTATVQIQFKRVLPTGQIALYPVLVDCPVFTLQGGGGAIQMPIVSGDQCIVLFSDRNINAWFQTGTQNVPADSRAHDLSDGVVLVGINAINSSLQSYVPDMLRIFYGGAEIDLANQIVTIKNDTTSLLTLLEGLIDVLKALTVQGPTVFPLTAASIAALEAYKLQLETLLG